MAVATLDKPLGAGLTEEDARAIYARGEETVVFAIRELSKRIAEQKAAASHQTPSTPSGMKPPFSKPSVSGRGKKKPGRKPGHQGARRKAPAHVDWESVHRADCCPDCGGRLNHCGETRTRYTEDIADIKPEVSEHTIYRDWCPKCRKKFEPPVPDALPGSQLGNRVLVLSAWLHYALGNTLSQIVEVFNFHLQMPLTAGGLVQMWYRLPAILYGWYEEIQQEALKSAVLHADETGWRVNGKTLWLWRRREELSLETYASRRGRLTIRLQTMIDTDWRNDHAKRLIKRLRRHQNDLFIFLDHPYVRFDNHHAERSIRPAVIIRKNSYGNRSQRGADCQAVLMSVFRTLKQRGHDSIKTVVNAISEYITTGELPPLPAPKSASHG